MVTPVDWKNVLKANFSLRITLIYMAVGGLWILLSDMAVEAIFGPENTTVQTLKGWFYIAVTGIMLYHLIERGLRIVRRSQTLLMESEERFRELVETTDDLILRTDAENRLVYLNPILARHLGSPVQDLLGKPFLDLVATEDREPVRSTLSEWTRTKRPKGTLEFRSPAADSKVRHLLANLHLRYADDGRPNGISLFAHDLTSRKILEERLNRTSVLQQSLVKVSASLIRETAPNLPEALKIISQIIGADHALFVLHHPEDPGPTDLFEWRADGAPSQDNAITASTLLSPWKERLEKGETLYLRNAPEEGWKEKDLSPVRSIILFPVLLDAGPPGLLRFDTRSVEMDFTEEEIELLRLSADIFSAYVQRHHAHTLLKASEERFRLAFEASPDAISISDLKTGEYLLVNRGFQRITGFSETEIIGQSPLDLKIWEDQADREALLSGLKEKGEVRNFESLCRMKDGSLRIGQMFAKPIEIQGRPCLFAYARDITEQKHTFMQLRESENKYRLLMDQAGDGILLISRNGWIEKANPKLGEMLEIPAEHLIGRLLSDFTPGDAPELRQLEPDRMAASTEQIFEATLLRSNGSRLQVEVNARRFNDGSVQAILRDLTPRTRAREEREQMEAKLRQQQKLEAIGTLAAGVAHEINNPINGVINYAQLIKDRMEEGSQESHFAGEIISESNRVAAIVRNLLSFSRQERDSHSPSALDDIVAETVALTRTMLRKDHILLEVDVPEDMPKIKCRNQQIKQVLMNLITNARHALNVRYPESDPKKSIRIESRLFTRDGAEWVRTVVEDFGTGITPEHQARIFDPFFTTKPRDIGTGLGLSVSHGIVRDHKGELWFESTWGRFTRFYLDLPVDNGWNLKSDLISSEETAEDKPL